MQVILISGLSGSGKSVALKVLEDSGYYCVDNLPVELLVETVQHLQGSGVELAAVAMDVRSGRGLDRLPSELARLRERGFDVRLIFLEANAESLVKRFSETRRRHPLSDDRLSLPECIQRERELLADIGNLGHRIDTSDLRPSTLRQWIKDLLDTDRSRLTLMFQSFGFKNGIPQDADLMFDVRCLPNPHYDPRLRPQTGRDPEVVAFLEADQNVRRMLQDIRRFVADWLPCFVRDNRSYLTVAIGCTGGRHRSVYFAERLAEHFEGTNQVLVRHRELAEAGAAGL